MPLTEEQIKEIKKQIFEQTKHFPAERRKQIQEQIEKMTPEQLELFVKQQMVSQGSSKEEPIFRAIVSGKIPSKIIDENKDVIAVLDIKPISKGHTIIIPKKAVTKANSLPISCFNPAKKVSKKISSKLKAKSTEIQTEFRFGEIIIDIIPIYDESLSINSPRKEISEKELEEVYNKLRAEADKPIKLKQKKSRKIIKLSRRIP